MRNSKLDLQRRLQEHSSILTMGIGAVSMYASNIYLKEFLTETDFGLFSLLITYFAILNSFGLLGLEQTFMRFSKIDDRSEIIISVTLRNKIIGALIILFIVSFFISEFHFFNSFYYGLICTLSITLSMLAYNVLRIKKLYHSSQLLLNSWRLLLGVLVAVILIFKTQIDYEFLLHVLSNGLLVILVLSSFILIRKIKIENDHSNKSYFDKKEFFATIYFMMILSSGSFIAIADRLFVDHYFSKVDFGNYVYYSVLILYPFNFLQNYLGFKFLVAFKHNKKIKSLAQKFTKNLIWISIGFAILIYLLNLLVNKIFDNDFFNYQLLTLILIATGIVKLFYSVYSSIIGSHAQIKTLKSINILFLLITLISVSILFLIPIRQMELIAFIFLILWLLRLIIWNAFSVKLSEYR